MKMFKIICTLYGALGSMVAFVFAQTKYFYNLTLTARNNQIMMCRIWSVQQLQNRLSGPFISLMSDEMPPIPNTTWIAYTQCDILIEQPSQIGNANAIVVGLVNNNCKLDKQQQNFPQIPLFALSGVCNMNTSPNVDITATITKEPSPNSNNGTPNNKPDDNSKVIQTYQTAMIVLYAVSGAVLGLFLAVIVANFIRNKLRSQPPSSSHSNNHSNPSQGRGITKAVLESFPVYLFSLRKNTETEEKDKGADDIELKSIVTDEKLTPINLEIEKSEKITVLSNDENDDQSLVNIPVTDKNISEENVEHSHKCFISTTSTISAPLNEILNEQLTCPICLGDFESGEELRGLPCNHQYHVSCIDPWLLDISTLCPMCKADYTSWNIETINTLQGEDSSTLTEPTGDARDTLPNSATSTHTFPHFRWIKYLTAIRRAGRRRRHSRRPQRGNSIVTEPNVQLQEQSDIGTSIIEAADGRDV